MTNNYITKTDFLLFLDSPLHLWAFKNNKVPRQQIDIFLQHLFQQGYEVEKYAKEYINQSVIPQYKAKEGDYLFQPTVKEEGKRGERGEKGDRGVDSASGKRNKKGEKGDKKGKYEARTDFIIKNPTTNKWDIYEIKSTTKVEKDHKYDATFQYLVFREKYDIGNTYILHLNKEYVRDGDISLRDLFVAENVNDEIQKLKEEVLTLRYDAYLIAKQDAREGIEACIRPKKCPCLSICHPNLPEYSIYDINNITRSESKVKELQSFGESIEDVPKDFDLSTKQRLQVDMAQRNKRYINKAGIKERFEKLTYPIFFLDYETFNPAIPLFDGYKPFDHITFQYSVHVKRGEGNKGEGENERGKDGQENSESDLEHYEYIHLEKTDPIPTLLTSLREIVGSKGSIVVWNKSFEAGRNKRMGEIYPKYEEFCTNMNERLFDLMEIFRDQLYIDPKIKGSYSIKQVLPLLVPELKYEDLNIKEGASAMINWYEMVYGTGDDVKDSLLKYCELDTLAMVRILEEVERIVEE
jgi:hypothetical protein